MSMTMVYVHDSQWPVTVSGRSKKVTGVAGEEKEAWA